MDYIKKLISFLPQNYINSSLSTVPESVQIEIIKSNKKAKAILRQLFSY